MYLGSKCYLDPTGPNPLEGMREGLTLYTEAFLETINHGNPKDLPLIIAALTNVTNLMKQSVFYKELPAAEQLTDLILSLFHPDFEMVSTFYPKDLRDKLMHAEEAEE